MRIGSRHGATRAHRLGLSPVPLPRACGKQFNERSGTLLNRAQYPSDVIALVVLWRLRYKLSLRDLPEMFAVRGIVFSHEAVREWEAKLTGLPP
jgi:putative transposase